MPPNWEVHHTKQQALADRYKAVGINVDDSKHLRAVPKVVHYEITAAQNKWAFNQMQKLGILEAGEKLTADNKKEMFERLWKKVDMNDVMKFEKELEGTYCKYWLKPGEKYKRVKEIIEITEGRAKQQLRMGKANRLMKLFPDMATGLAVFGVIGDGASVAQSVLKPNQQQQDAFETFINRYESLLAVRLQGDELGRDSFDLLKDDFMNYLKVSKINDTVINQLDRAWELALAGK